MPEKSPYQLTSKQSNVEKRIYSELEKPKTKGIVNIYGSYDHFVKLVNINETKNSNFK